MKRCICGLVWILIALAVIPTVSADGFKFLNGGQSLGAGVRPEISVTLHDELGYVAAYVDGSELTFRAESLDGLTVTPVASSLVLSQIDAERVLWVSSGSGSLRFLLIGASSGSPVAVSGIVQQSSPGFYEALASTILPFQTGTGEGLLARAFANRRTLAAAAVGSELHIAELTPDAFRQASVSIDPPSPGSDWRVHQIRTLPGDEYLLVLNLNSGGVPTSTWNVVRASVGSQSSFRIAVETSGSPPPTFSIDGTVYLIASSGGHSAAFVSNPGWASIPNLVALPAMTGILYPRYEVPESSITLLGWGASGVHLFTLSQSAIDWTAQLFSGPVSAASAIPTAAGEARISLQPEVGDLVTAVVDVETGTFSSWTSAADFFGSSETIVPDRLSWFVGALIGMPIVSLPGNLEPAGATTLPTVTISGAEYPVSVPAIAEVSQDTWTSVSFLTQDVALFLSSNGATVAPRSAVVSENRGQRVLATILDDPAGPLVLVEEYPDE